jgi:GH15 family glucan-1,4-alpha-glucosidase
MALPLEDYAMLGDTHTAALVGRDGSIDWLCLPRFDSDACFAALLGTPRHGRWLLAPAERPSLTVRAYRPRTLVLDTEHQVPGGVLRVTDCMPPRRQDPDLVRVATAVRGRVAVRMELAPRFGYGAGAPWVRQRHGGASLVAGPDALRLWTDVPLRIERDRVRAELELDEGRSASFRLAWHRSFDPAPPHEDVAAEIAGTERYWRAWGDRCRAKGPWQEARMSSLLVLKALTFAPSGGIVAAPTTSLPERLGGVRNWDYRYCWVRDATFTLLALIDAGYTEEAAAWRDWLLRATAGDPAELQVLYGPAGERRLMEQELPWLPGYEGSRPVRMGNGASTQFQLDVIGELTDCLHQARAAGLPEDPQAWDLQRTLLDHLEGAWRDPDEGIWEVRGGRRPFTHSKVMAWAAFDRAVRTVERLGTHGPVERWRRLRDEIHAEVCARAFDPERNAFVQSYGSDALDASLLRIPLVGFLPATDPRVLGTIDAVRRELEEGGLVRRYRNDGEVDGLPKGEGVFLPCSFWLVDALVLAGRRAEAQALFERLLALRNDVGLLSEEYDVARGRLVGNFPQAFSHVALANSARNLGGPEGPADRRRGR